MIAEKPSGPAAAAILAAAIGVFTIGLMTTLAEVSAGLKNALNWWNPAGPLTGKTGVGVIVWLIAWLILGTRSRGRSVEMGRIALWSWILILLGLVLTFPPVFEAFAR
jgi:lysylphosphatidylglycerol synthetase-like protein (DUF2156 family)